MLKLLTMLVVLFFAQPVFVQEKPPELPDYTKLELGGWDITEVFYKSNQARVLSERYYKVNGSKGYLEVIYKPFSKDKKDPLFAFYLEDEYGRCVYIYEKTSKWYEFYYLYKSKWRLVGEFINPVASENHEDAEKIDKFIEERFELKFKQS